MLGVWRAEWERKATSARWVLTVRRELTHISDPTGGNYHCTHFVAKIRLGQIEMDDSVLVLKLTLQICEFLILTVT